eukprot:jgi/Psemu1/32667/gm1.32667_g
MSNPPKDECTNGSPNRDMVEDDGNNNWSNKRLPDNLLAKQALTPPLEEKSKSCQSEAATNPTSNPPKDEGTNDSPSNRDIIVDDGNSSSDTDGSYNSLGAPPMHLKDREQLHP